MSLDSIKRELQNIINELDSIAAGVKRDFSGIGNDKCSQSITAAANKLRSAKNSINNINTSRIAEEFLPKEEKTRKK